MKKGIWILTLGLLLLSCGKKEQKRTIEDDNEEPVVEQMVADSIASTTQEETSKYEDAKGSTGKIENSSEDYDNMRGFDPASEDDMDDNGMSRYMENNDEEGWD